ncbi:MAG TPA: Rieske 2Fe-2S domain-containing protein [Acidimicrobiia bacterium]|nr:Rieske 2Fe-2S domain-containing protein [Acidimicrobiia bacterium]
MKASANGYRAVMDRRDITASLHRLVTQIENIDALDIAANVVTPLVDRMTRSDRVKRTLSGVDLGHRLHPMLTDVPIGCWTTASVLDVIAGRAGRRPARQLVGLGIAAALPTVATGLSDWRDTYGGSRRLGVVHMTANTFALGLECASWTARRRGRHLRGALYSACAIGAATFGGYLGGHLVFAERVGVDHEVPTLSGERWHAACAESDLVDDEPFGATVREVPLVLVRHRGLISALAAVCSHAGGPLAEGKLVGDAIECPWHHSEFCLHDGSVVRGPAVTAQPAYETRVRSGRVEVRLAPAAADMVTVARP